MKVLAILFLFAFTLFTVHTLQLFDEDAKAVKKSASCAEYRGSCESPKVKCCGSLTCKEIKGEKKCVPEIQKKPGN